MEKDSLGLPVFSYFKQKNPFSGSIGQKFNYKIWCGETLSVKAWKGLTCFTKTPRENFLGETEAELSPEGLEEVKEWICRKYEEYKRK